MDNPSELLKIAEVAQLLGVTRRTVYRRIWASELPASKIGGLYFIKRSDINALLNKGTNITDERFSKTDPKQSSLIKCGSCLRIIQSYNQISQRCQAKDCEKIICDQCVQNNILVCREHKITSSQKLYAAQQMLQSGEIDLLLKGSEARLREMNFLNRIYSRFTQINTIIHPISGELLTIQDWDQYLKKSDQRAEVLKLKQKVMLDSNDLAEIPINASYQYTIPAQKKQNNASLIIKISVISRLEEMVQDGFDIQPMTSEELMKILVKLSEEESTDNSFQLIVLASTTGWDSDARAVILGDPKRGDGSAFVHPGILIYLFDLETNQLIFNNNDDRLKQYVELFTPLLVTEETNHIIPEIEKLLASRGHDSLALSDAVKSLPYSERLLRQTFEKMQASGRYKIIEIPDLGGSVIIQK